MIVEVDAFIQGLKNRLSQWLAPDNSLLPIHQNPPVGNVLSKTVDEGNHHSTLYWFGNWGIALSWVGFLY